MSLEITVREFDGRPEEWDAFCLSHPDGTFSHRYGWMRLVQQLYGGTPFYLAAYRDGRLVGALPVMLRRVLGAGRILLSPPFADEGGICASEREVEDALLDAAADLGKEARAAYLELRHLRRRERDDLLCDTSRVALRMPLPATTEELWEGLSANMRSKVRRAGKRGLRAKDGGPQAVPTFYRVYAANSRDLGSPMHSVRLFHGLFEAFPGDVLAVLVSSEAQADNGKGEPPAEDTGGAAGSVTRAAGAAIAVRFGRVLSVPWPHSLRAYHKDYCNNLLYWRILEAAIEWGCTVVDFGRSPVGTGPYEFKKSWRMEDHQLYYQFLPLRTRPSLEDRRSGRAYRLFSVLWQRVPLGLATAVGPRIMARIPV